jgi:DNA-binding CsgD family transcriptional regulator/tetratricopeptide (TPR) repeat protein
MTVAPVKDPGLCVGTVPCGSPPTSILDPEMASQVPTARGGPRLYGRTAECARLDELLGALQSGLSGALVVRGEAGSGKTALLDYAAAGSDGCRVERATGVESEMELPFATLHQLCLPLLDRIEALPAPQADALKTAFGLSAGRRPDSFLVGLAVLTLLSDAADSTPLICVVDDAQWLDHSSAVVLAFVARRLEAESVLLVFAEREDAARGELDGLPELNLGRLSPTDSRELLASVSLGPLDEGVVERIIDEAHGNPLALLELPRGTASANLAGGFAVPETGPIASRIEASFRRRAAELPEDTQRLLLVGAADPLGDPTLLWRAADTLGIPVEAAAPAEESDLLEVGARVTFRHPLLRSAIYGAAPPPERREAHRALAEATDPERDPDRRAWHRAHATLAQNEEVASELERSADRARARGGLAAAAAFLERAAELTPDPHLRVTRALDAARRKRLAGLAEAAQGLLATAEQGTLDDLDRALVVRLRAQIAWDESPGGQAPLLLLQAARQLEPLDIDLARDTYLEALFAASNAGRLGGGVIQPARAARAGPAAMGVPDTSDLLLNGLAVLFTEGHAAAAPLLKQALALARDEQGRDEHALRAIRIASRVAAEVLDDVAWSDLATRHVRVAREDGILSTLPVTLNYLASLRIYEGDLEAAAMLLDESDSISWSTAGAPADVTRLMLAAYRGEEAETLRRRRSLEAVAAATGEGLLLTVCEYGSAILYNGLAQYEAALGLAAAAVSQDDLSVSVWALPELIEAAVRSGRNDVAAAGFEALAERTIATGTDFARGLEARSRGLVSEGAVAEASYREGIEVLGGTSMRMFLARAQLLYGEWLRRENRRVEAREQLRPAHEFFDRIGAEGFSARAGRELAATGLTVRKRVDETRRDLTPQEAQIARLAGDGYTNPEIGAQLFLSPRTVEWHLRKVFAKLDISSRRQLREVLPGSVHAA